MMLFSFIRKSLLFGIVFMLSIFLVSCGSDSDSSSDKKDSTTSSIDSIKANGKLRVGVFSDKPPFGYVNANGEYDGFDVYIAKRFAKDLLGDSSKIEFVPVEAAFRVEYLKSNKVDIIMANFTKTPEREKVVDFAKPYMKVSLAIISKDGVINSEEALNGKTLIVNKGTTADIYFSAKSGFEMLKFDQNTETFNSFLQGRGDALAHDSTLLYAWVKDHPEYKVGVDSVGGQDVIAPAVKKGDKELLDWINGEIDALSAEGFFAKAYDETLKEHFSDDVKPESVIFN